MTDNEYSPTDPNAETAPSEPRDEDAREEVLEAIEHLKNAATLLFGRAKRDPAVKQVAQDAERFVQTLGAHAENGAQRFAQTAEPVAKKIAERAEPIAQKISEHAEPVARQIGDAAEPIAKQLSHELGRLTQSVLAALNTDSKRNDPPSD